MVGRCVETGTRWGCFVGTAIGCACVGVTCVVTVDDSGVVSLVALVEFDVNLVVLLAAGRGRLVVNLGKLCVVGGLL